MFQAGQWGTRIDRLRAKLLGFAVGNVFGAGVGGVGEGDFASVGGLDVVVDHAPVFCVCDGAGGLGLDVEVVELEVDQRCVGIGGDREGFLCAGGLDVPDMDFGEVREALIFGDWGGEGDPVGWNRLRVGAFGQFGVAVGGIPIHVDRDGNRDAGKCEVVDADIGGIAAANVRGLEQDAVGDAGFCGDVPGFNVVEAAGGLGAEGDGGGAAVDDGVVNFDVLGGAVHAEAVGVASGFEAEGVIVDVDVSVGDVDIARGVDVDAVGGGAVAVLVIADDEAVDDNIVGVEDLDGPEAGALQGEAAAVVDVVRVLDQGEADALSVVVGRPAEAFGLVDGEGVAENLPPDSSVAINRAFAGDGDVVLIAEVNHRGRPGHLDAGDAGGKVGKVLDVLRADEGDAVGDLEGDAGFEEEGAGEVGSRFEAYGSFFGSGGFDGLLDGGSVERCTVAFGSVVVGEKYLWCGVRVDGSESQEEGEGEGCGLLDEEFGCRGHGTSPLPGYVAQSH